MKTCIKCNEQKDLDQFGKTKTYIRNTCKSCFNLDQKARSKKHYENNKDYYFARNKKDRISLREFYIQLKHNKPCLDCKDVFPWWILEFDHRDPSTKVDDVSSLVKVSKRKLLEEIDKCDLICSNCHKERTHKRLIGMSI